MYEVIDIGTVIGVGMLLLGSFIHAWGEWRYQQGLEEGRKQGRLINRYVRRGEIYRIK